MKILVLGGVAAGTKVAAKLKRENRDHEVIILNKGKNISYAGCGLPYYVGHVIEDKDQLIVNTSEKYSKLTGVEVYCETEAIKVDVENKKVIAIDLNTNKENSYEYDKLVIATGARPLKPSIEGCNLENVFVMRTPEDAIALREIVDAGKIKKAVIVGAGYIGLEIAENLREIGVRPFVFDMSDQILNPGFDKEMADYIENKLIESGIPIVSNVTVTGIEGNGKVEKVITNKKTYKTDLVVLSAGICPNTEFLNNIGLEMIKGCIVTNEFGETSLADIYAAGDCAVVKNALTNKPAWSAMGSTANITGRIIAQNINGSKLPYRGTLATAVCKLPGFNIGRTGLTEKQSKEEGYDPISVISVVDDKAHYYAGASMFIIKMIADKVTKKLLGIQVIGSGSVDKIVDIAVTGIMLKATLDDLSDMDLAYAPPFSTAIHPLMHTINILKNKLVNEFNTFTPIEYAQGLAKDYKIIDSCIQPTIEGAPYIELTDVDGPLNEYKLDEKLLLVCNKGKRAYLLQNRLKYFGYTNTKVLEGGITFNDVEVE